MDETILFLAILVIDILNSRLHPVNQEALHPVFNDLVECVENEKKQVLLINRMGREEAKEVLKTVVILL